MPSSPNPANAENHTLRLFLNVTGKCSHDGFDSACHPSLILNMPGVKRFLAVEIVPPPPPPSRKWEGPWSGPETWDGMYSGWFYQATGKNVRDLLQRSWSPRFRSRAGKARELKAEKSRVGVDGGQAGGSHLDAEAASSPGPTAGVGLAAGQQVKEAPGREHPAG